jgi:hypothetical protein
MGNHIDIHDDYQLKDWANRLRMTQEELKKLVGEFGPDSDRIHDILKQRELSMSSGRVLPTEPL